MKKILYIAGAGRSGSTLLARVLRTAGEAVVAPGELLDLWQEGFLENRVCECGKRFDACAFWQQVVERSGLHGTATASEAIACHATIARTRHLPRLIVTRDLDRLFSRQPHYLEILGSLYASLFEVSRARVVVDASKSPSYATVLKAVPGLDVYVVHLIRDPRGVAWSWNKKRVNPSSGRAFGRLSFSKSATLWATWNVATSALLGVRAAPNRYLRLRYEDLVADPTTSVRRVLQFVGEPAARLPAPDDEGRPTLCIAKDHSIGGNPGKFAEGPTRFALDTSWRREMPGRAFTVVTAITWPLLVRYGYRVARSSAP